MIRIDAAWCDISNTVVHTSRCAMASHYDHCWTSLEMRRTQNAEESPISQLLGDLLIYPLSVLALCRPELKLWSCPDNFLSSMTRLHA
jgi:hypothetical protein